MKLTQQADYGLRILIYLGLRPEERVKMGDIATAYAISHSHLTKVVPKLVNLGYVHSQQGRGGGLSLAKAPQEISIGEVVRALEPDFELVECFNREENTCPLVPHCRLMGIFGEAKAAFLKVLGRHTLAEVLGAGVPLRRALGIELEALS